MRQERLQKYLVAAVPGFPAQARLEVRQFQHGQSNPTYLLRALLASGAPAQLYVLRKKPPGQVRCGCFPSFLITKCSGLYSNLRCISVAMCCQRSSEQLF